MSRKKDKAFQPLGPQKEPPVLRAERIRLSKTVSTRVKPSARVYKRKPKKKED